MITRTRIFLIPIANYLICPSRSPVKTIINVNGSLFTNWLRLVSSTGISITKNVPSLTKNLLMWLLMDRYNVFMGLVIFLICFTFIAIIISYTYNPTQITQGWYEGEVLPIETLEFPQGDMVLSVTSICTIRQLHVFMGNHYEKNWIGYDDFNGCKIILARSSGSISAGTEIDLNVDLTIPEQ